MCHRIAGTECLSQHLGGPTLPHLVAPATVVDVDRSTDIGRRRPDDVLSRCFCVVRACQLLQSYGGECLTPSCGWVPASPLRLGGPSVAAKPVYMGHGTQGTVTISASPDRSDPLFNWTCSRTPTLRVDVDASTGRRRRVDVAKGTFGRVMDRCGPR